MKLFKKMAFLAAFTALLAPALYGAQHAANQHLNAAQQLLAKGAEAIANNPKDASLARNYIKLIQGNIGRTSGPVSSGLAGRARKIIPQLQVAVNRAAEIQAEQQAQRAQAPAVQPVVTPPVPRRVRFILPDKTTSQEEVNVEDVEAKHAEAVKNQFKEALRAVAASFRAIDILMDENYQTSQGKLLTLNQKLAAIAELKQKALETKQTVDNLKQQHGDIVDELYQGAQADWDAGYKKIDDAWKFLDEKIRQANEKLDDLVYKIDNYIEAPQNQEIKVAINLIAQLPENKKATLFEAVLKVMNPFPTDETLATYYQAITQDQDIQADLKKLADDYIKTELEKLNTDLNILVTTINTVKQAHPSIKAQIQNLKTAAERNAKKREIKEQRRTMLEGEYPRTPDLVTNLLNGLERFENIVTDKNNEYSLKRRFADVQKHLEKIGAGVSQF